MSKTRLERIANIDDVIRQLKNRQKELQQQQNEQERKARTNRLCKRGGLCESLLPRFIAAITNYRAISRTHISKSTAQKSQRSRKRIIIWRET